MVYGCTVYSWCTGGILWVVLYGTIQVYENIILMVRPRYLTKLADLTRNGSNEFNDVKFANDKRPF